MNSYVKIKLIVCLGDYSNTNNFFAFTSAAEVFNPVPRGEILLCPINKHISIPVIVSESRIGGEEAILVTYSNEPPDQDLIDAFNYSNHWSACKPASALRGEVIGVFADEEIQDLVTVETWPEWQHEELQIMVSLGFLDTIHELNIISISNDSEEVSSDQDNNKIVKFTNWQNKKEDR